MFQGKCHNCHERGHFARDCPKRNWKTDSASTPGKGKKVQGAGHCAEKQNLRDEFPEEALPVYTSREFGGSNWIIDSGATQHMTFEKDCLSDYVVNLGDNRSILAYGKRNYRIKAVVDDHIQPLCLRDVLYLPELEKNLLSVCAMIKLGATVLFEDGVVKIICNSKLLATGVMRGKLYVLKMLIPDEQVNVAERSSSLQLCHYRLGHLGMGNVNKMMNEQMVDGMNSVNDEKSSVCEACIMGKQHCCPHPRGHAERSTQPFEVVHSDVCGPMSVSSFGGSCFYVTFIDDYTRYNCVYFMKNKSEVLEKLKEFHNFATNLAGNRIKVLRSDNGGEYCSRNFDEYLKQKGITRQLTVPNNSAQNGLAERMNRTIVESATSMMFHSNLSVNFWAEAVNMAVYLKNRSPTTALDGITPYECLFNRKPDVAHLRVFGCIAFHRKLFAIPNL